ncbi:hypothetical protein FACS1894152_6250 [Bacilli bacterium]|nr:hypothetical protein FACS1894152_6250 [Bacilli bacterium]
MHNTTSIEEKEIKFFHDKKKDAVPFEEWRDKQEKTIKKLVEKRLLRVRKGNYGSHRFLGGGVFELKFDNGLRVYFAEVGNCKKIT